MAGTLTWSATLKDGMSAPAARAAAGLAAMTNALRVSGQEAERAQRKQEAHTRATVARDAVAKLQERNRGQEAGARGDLSANMGRYDAVAAGMRREATAAGQLAAARQRLQKAEAASELNANMQHNSAVALERTKQKADAAAKAMDKLRSSARGAASATASISQGRGSFRGGSVGGQSLAGPGKGLGGMAKIQQFFGQEFGDKAAAAVGAVTQKLAGMGEMLGKVSAYAGPIGQVFSTLLAGATIAATAAAAVGAALVGIGMKAGMYIGSLQAVKQASTFAFEKLLGSSGAAKAAWADVRQGAEDYGMSIQDSAASLNGLLAQKFSLAEAKEFVGLMADLKTINPTANVEAMTRAISQIKAKGKLTQEELTGQLGDAGLAPESVYIELQAKLGKNREQILAMISEGKISSDEGIAAIKKAISKQTGGGPAGSLAKAAVDASLIGQVMRARAALDGFLSDLNIDWGPMTSMLGKVTGVLKGDAGAAFGKSIENAFARVGAALDRVTPEQIATGFQMLGAVATAAGFAIELLLDAVNSIVGAFSNDKSESFAKFFQPLENAAFKATSTLTAMNGALTQTQSLASRLSFGGGGAMPGLAQGSLGGAPGGGGPPPDTSWIDAIIAKVSGSSTAAGGAAPGAPAGAATPGPTSKTSTRNYYFNAVGITDAEFVERVRTVIREEDAAGGDDD